MRRQGKGKLIPSAIFETEAEEGGEAGTSVGTGNGGGAERVVRLLEAQLLTSSLCAAMGISCDGLDAGLCELLRLTQRSSSSWNGGSGSTAPTAEPPLNLQYHIACLFIVFVANALPQLARVSGCAYQVNLAANEGNTHCIAYAVTTLMVRLGKHVCTCVFKSSLPLALLCRRLLLCRLASPISYTCVNVS